MRDVMEQNKTYPEPAGAGSISGIMRREDVTLRENIDQRIRQAEATLKELQDTKERLQTSGLLDTRIDDLSRAMRY